MTWTFFCFFLDEGDQKDAYTASIDAFKDQKQEKQTETRERNRDRHSAGYIQFGWMVKLI